TSEWIQFFKDAGIPPGPAVSYAFTFVDNRIQKNMLLDLNKEIMNELGITVVGDIIAILKHAKIVYQQEMCKAATESLNPNSTVGQTDLRRNVNSAASRMIANSLSRDSPAAVPPRARPHAAKISVTVSNKMAASRAGELTTPEENPVVPAKRRRVTAEMEGKYIISMPKGTTPRTRRILEQQAARGLQRTSVFERLGAEAKADTTAGGKPTGVFSRLGDTLGTEGDKATESDDDDDDDDCSVLQYAGVLKKLAQPGRTMAMTTVGSTPTVGSTRVGSTPTVGSTRVGSTPTVGSMRVGSTRVGSTRVGSMGVGSTRVESRGVESTRVGSMGVGLTGVGSTRVGSIGVESTRVGSMGVGSTRVGSRGVESMSVESTGVGSTRVGSIGVESTRVGSMGVGSTRVGSRGVESMSVESTGVGSTRVGSMSVESTSVGSPTIGSRVVGSTSVGSTSVGSTSVGSTRVGSTSVGSTRVGSTSVGSTRVGSTSVGSMTIKLKATSSEAKLVTIPTSTQRLTPRNIHPPIKPQPAPPKTGIMGISTQSLETPDDDDVTTTKEKNPPEFRVMIKRTWGCGKVSSTSEIPGAQMDSAGTVSVFKRLGKKPD
ncbi:uncharacterized protein C19orf47 homolog, partial [Antrostomus carolinensis]|uniref:uncharacterized protein C19orf47 homolog n=1 Tax=Antrostomus carolinensis TaxID=279965 RepID=UPI0005287A91